MGSLLSDVKLLVFLGQLMVQPPLKPSSPNVMQFLVVVIVIHSVTTFTIECRFVSAIVLDPGVEK